MSWTQALVKFAQIALGVLIFALALHVLIVWYGRNQVYSRLDSSVLKNISDIMYLNENKSGFVIENDSDLSLSKLSSTQFVHLQSEDDRVTINTDAQCFFVYLNFDTSRTQNYDEILDPLKDFECVFIQTPYSNAKNYFSGLKPRWFYGVRLSQWLQFIFLNSLFLEPAAPLEGDFVVINQSPTDLHPRVLKEIQRRKLILFVQK